MTLMEETDRRDDFTSQLSAHIWGHRFKDGQRGPEYVLEFLNVLSGTEYTFARDYYNRRFSSGLRKFIFEGMKEGNSGSTLVLDDDLKTKLVQAFQDNNTPILKQFLRNLEIVFYNTDGKEADRSWFARSLYPLHESLLYFELRTKNGKDTLERNFYARGGELYFLMLNHGTEHHSERRFFIERRFRQILTKNKVIEKVVSTISAVFENSTLEDRESRGNLRAVSGKGPIPLLPEYAEIENKELFEQFGTELEFLLLMDMDVHEMFHLLTSLVCFQLSRYMQARSQPDLKTIIYFFDCMEGTNSHIYRQAARSLEYNEAKLKERYLVEFEVMSNKALGDAELIERLLPEWKENEGKPFLKWMGLNNLKSRSKLITNILKKCSNAADVQTVLKNSVREVVTAQLDQVQVTRVMSRDGGFATYRRGSASNYRYTISDSFLQMLVFTMVKPQEKMEFHAFLSRLRTDYGIVLGEQEAKTTGIYEQSGINVRYFQDNERALRKKLRHNGLLIEFSDATAMIQNPYARCDKEVGSYA